LKLAFIGDIVGKPGRDMIAKYLPKLREEYGLDLVIANYENASHGFGLTKKNCEELLGNGIDVMTGGRWREFVRSVMGGISPSSKHQSVISPVSSRLHYSAVTHTALLMALQVGTHPP